MPSPGASNVNSGDTSIGHELNDIPAWIATASGYTTPHPFPDAWTIVGSDHSLEPRMRWLEKIFILEHDYAGRDELVTTRAAHSVIRIVPANFVYMCQSFKNHCSRIACLLTWQQLGQPRQEQASRRANMMLHPPTLRRNHGAFVGYQMAMLRPCITYKSLGDEMLRALASAHLPQLPIQHLSRADMFLECRGQLRRL